MKKNNKGFSMVEIIGAVIIMGVILLLIIPGISKLMAQFRNDYYEKLEGTTNEAGKNFYNDDKLYLPDGILESAYINAGSLINEKYLENLLDYRGNSCKTGDRQSYTIVIYKGDGKYEYKACIDCSDDGYVTNKKGTYCDPAWLENNLSYDYGDTNDIYFYYGTSREKIREDLIKRLNIVKYDNNGNILDRVVIGDTNEEGILPINIDIIDNKPVLDSNNKKAYLMIYGSDLDEDKVDDNELYAVIYKHKAPKVTMTTVDGIYTSGNWTNKNVVIKLEKNDNFFTLAKRKVKNYQWSVNGGVWQDIECDMIGSDDSCTISLTDSYLESNYRFRLVNDEGNISDETSLYYVKIDKYPSIIILDVINNTVVEELTTDPDTNKTQSAIIQYAQVSVSVSDAHSGIENTRVCIGTSCQTFTGSTQTFYYSSSGTVTATTYDRAGNSSSDSGNIYYEQIDNTTSYCTIYYDANGGSASKSSETVECGSYVTLPTATKNGYTLNGWYTTKNQLVGQPGYAYVVSYDQTVYANWGENKPEEEKPSEDNCKIIYDPNGGTVNPTSQTVKCGTQVTLPTPTRNNYTFIAWYTAKTGGSLVGNAGSKYTVNNNITVYARWNEEQTGEQEEPKKTYTIYYNGNGDSCKNGATCPEKTVCEVDKPCTLATNNYKMANYHDKYGWNKNSSGTGTSYNGGETVINLAPAGGSITLYSYYECDWYHARAKNPRVIPFDKSTWPWSLVNWDSNNKYLSKTSDYGCSAIGKSDTCISDELLNSTSSNKVWQGYPVRCKFCGYASNATWCPVHSANGGKDIEICDSTTNTYSSSTCKRGVAEGWTKVSK